MYKWGQALSNVRGLRSINLISTLLEGGQFHAYLTAQAQNAVLGRFASPANARTPHSLIYD